MKVTTNCRRCLRFLQLEMTEQEHATITGMLGLRLHKPVCDVCLAKLDSSQSEVIADGRPSS